MVKLFLVCFVVCMGATSEAFFVGPCTGQVKNLLDLSQFVKTLTLCAVQKSSVSQVQPQGKHEITFREDKSTIPGTIKKIAEFFNGAETTTINYQQTTVGGVKKLTYTTDKGGSGESFNEQWCEHYVLNEMCSSSGKAGTKLVTMWAENCDNIDPKCLNVNGVGPLDLVKNK